MSNPRFEWVVNIDGASRGNPGAAASAVIIKSADGAPVASFTRRLGKTTNNFAEYQALLAALEYAVKHGQRRLRVRSDSELLVRQILGQYKVKNSGLKPLYQRARQMIGQLDAFSISHIPREANREADGLANEALDGQEQ